MPPIRLPTQNLDDCLGRMRAREAIVHAVVALDEYGARRDAANSDARTLRGESLSPVDGLVILVKANISVAGLPWTAGIGAYRERVAEHDALCVARLRAGGAIILGTTNMDEGALGATCDNPWFGRTDNPRAPDYCAGGSSGGSAAAVAAGFCDAALGTDTIGSVRIPASYCGVFGYKPAYGTIPTEGVVALSPAHDCIGVLAATATTCGSVALVAAGCGGIFAPSPLRPIGPMQIGVLLPEATTGANPELTNALARTVAAALKLGLAVIAIPPKAFPGERVQQLLFMASEIAGAVVHRQALRAKPEGFSAPFAKMLYWGAGRGAQQSAEINAELDMIRTAMLNTLAAYDAILLPTTLEAAFARDMAPPQDQASQVAIASLLGFAAMAFPIGYDARGRPLSCQIIAASEAVCLELAGSLATSYR